MTMKFIMGTEPIANYDAYANQVKKLGIDKALEIYQKAYVRYQNRK
jgi:putative aldouronate transport system substrate-binding protein